MGTAGRHSMEEPLHFLSLPTVHLYRFLVKLSQVERGLAGRSGAPGARFISALLTSFLCFLFEAFIYCLSGEPHKAICKHLKNAHW